MTVEIEQRADGSHALVVVGRLDGPGAQTLEARITAMVARGDTRVVLDCARMTYLNSAGVRALLICARSCRRAGGSFTVCAPCTECAGPSWRSAGCCRTWTITT